MVLEAVARRWSCRGFRVSCYRVPSCIPDPHRPSLSLSVSRSRPERIRKIRGWPLVPLYAVWDLRPSTWALLPRKKPSTNATAALITLVATHMLNVYPVMPAAAAPLPHSGGHRERERERKRCGDATYPPVVYSLWFLLLAMQIRSTLGSIKIRSSLFRWCVYANAEKYWPESNHESALCKLQSQF